MSSSPIAIRSATPRDFAQVLELWTASGAPATVTDRARSLGALLALDPQALLIAEADGRLVGSLIAAWNGWRGSFYRLAVHPEHRHQGLATRLVAEGERRLRDRGAVRLDAIVASGEPTARAFWGSVGYAHQRDRSRFVRNFTDTP